MNRIFSGILACMLMLSPINAQENPATPYIPQEMEVTGAVIVSTPRTDPRNPEGPKLGNSAIVNGRIWWEGQTIKVRKADDSWVTLTLTKVEMVEGKGGVLTFTVELTRHLDKPTFQVSMKKSTGWGLQKAKK